MPSLPTIELYSDIHCPWAYMALFRLRKVWPDYQSRLRIAFRSLSLEVHNRRPTPRPTLEVEIPLIMLQQPDLPIRQWRAPDWRYVPTLLPAFEAEKAAGLQGDDAVWEFTWRLRHAFFAENRTICMRHELAAIAEESRLDVDRFLCDWDSGLLRRLVLDDTRRGWKELEAPGSPTFVLPSGVFRPNPGAMRLEWAEDETRIASSSPPGCPDGDCLQAFREMLDAALG
jgi:predicted DsbA family dithiol-disulfide isomerase